MRDAELQTLNQDLSKLYLDLNAILPKRIKKTAMEIINKIIDTEIEIEKYCES